MKLRRILTSALFITAILYFIGCSGYTENITATMEAHDKLILPKKPDSMQIASIVQTSRIWGFAKYHHPAFSSDTISADAEFFKLLTDVLSHPDSLQNQVFTDWITSLGPFTIQDEEKNKSLEVFNGFQWISDTLTLGQSLSHTLQRLRRADSKNNKYVQQTQVNVSFIEPVYNDIPKEDIAYRLLGVAKFWNAIDSYSPNRNLTDKPWDAVLKEYTVLAFDRSVNFSKLYSRMVSELRDSHVNTWLVPIFGGRFVPMSCRFAEDRLFITDTCTLVPNDFQVGDEILCIDSICPIDRLAATAPYQAYSNRAALLKAGSYAALLTGKDEAQIAYRRDGEIYVSKIPTVTAEKFMGYLNTSNSLKEEKKFKELPNGIAYIRMDNLTSNDDQDLGEFLQDHDKLIIDLRAYPAEYEVLHQLLPEYFFSESRSAVVVRLPQAHQPGKWICSELKTSSTSNPQKLFKGRIVLLVNSESQSMAEFFTMFLQTIPDVMTIGSQTAGADGDVTQINLPYAVFNFTGAGILYPDGTNAQRNGVKIDIVVEPSPDGLMHGQDEQLQAAIDYLSKDQK